MGRRPALENMEVMADLRKHYFGKKVFLTGHTGFKGAWMLLLLHYLGAKVKGYALPPQTNSLYSSVNGSTLCDSTYADIRDYNLLTQSILDFKPDYVFHMAAQPLVIESYEKPVETFGVNVIGTVNVLDVLKHLKTNCNAVIITTDKVYEQGIHKQGFRETDKLGGHDPYSASKACCELAVQSFHKSFFSSGKPDGYQVRVASARSGNVIGGGDWAENRIVPDLIRSIQDKKPLFLRNPQSVRPWQHVLDALLGYVTLATKLHNQVQEISLSWNFAPLEPKDITVKEVALQFFKILNRGTFEETPSDQAWHEAPYLKLNAYLAHERLGWTPRLDPWRAIEWTAIWYKNVVFEGQNSRDVSLTQIENYLRS